MEASAQADQLFTLRLPKARLFTMPGANMYCAWLARRASFRENARPRSYMTTPLGAVNVSSTIFPVLRVWAGSNTSTSASASAIVRCSTP
jgi:hypothetical protein